MNITYRIKKNEEFKKIIDQRHVLKFKSMIVYYAKNSLENSRFGLSVSKKIGNAVTRNTIKRRFRACIMEISVEDLCIDFIMIARKPVLDMNFIEIKNDFILMSKKLKEKLNEEKA